MKHLISIQNGMETFPRFEIVDFTEKDEKDIEENEATFEEVLDEYIILHNMDSWQEIPITKKTLEAFENITKELKELV